MHFLNSIDCELRLGIKIRPIIPYPATEYNAIFMTMINFKDVLKQKKHENGPLWSDEGVYHTAKIIQLLYSQKISNIVLGIGGFHLEKVVIGCLGMYLESSDIQNLLIEEKVYGHLQLSTKLQVAEIIFRVKEECLW